MFCKFCGSALSADGSCPNCQAEKPAAAKGLCCPNCGNKNLSVVTDRDIGGAILGGMAGMAVGGKLGGAASAAGHLTQQTFWVCPGCGNRFRNPQELIADAKSYRNKFKVIMGISTFIGILCLICVFTPIRLLGIIGLVITGLCFLLGLIPYNQAKNCEQQYKDITSGIERFN